MEIINLGDEISILNQFVSEIRDISIQKDRMRFRRNMERIGEIMAYEISRKMEYHKEEIETPLGSCMVKVLNNQPVIASILRAGLPFHQGFLNFFDQAENAFISAFRKHTTENDFFIQLDYLSSPAIENKLLILCDPMLATALSIEKVYHALIKNGKPYHTHFACVIATKQGLKYLVQKLEGFNVTVWTAAIDPSLTAKSYIVPGLGDAGDLAFGEKL